MNISKEQLPMQQFERLGIQKERMDTWPKDELKALLSGYPGQIKFLTFKDNEGTLQKINARLSVYQALDGNIGLKIHPFRKEIKNDLQLTQKEIEQLKSGESIRTTSQGNRYLVQLDQSINELRRIRIDQIRVADKIGNTRLSVPQQEDLKSGKTITIKDGSGNEKRMRIDLSSPSGIHMENRQLARHQSPVHPPNEQKESRQQENMRMKR